MAKKFIETLLNLVDRYDKANYVRGVPIDVSRDIGPGSRGYGVIVNLNAAQERLCDHITPLLPAKRFRTRSKVVSEFWNIIDSISKGYRCNNHCASELRKCIDNKEFLTFVESCL